MGSVFYALFAHKHKTVVLWAIVWKTGPFRALSLRVGVVIQVV